MAGLWINQQHNFFGVTAMADRYITIEAPDRSAKIDFLGSFGCVVSAEWSTNKAGKPEIYVMVKAADDRGSILGEIVAEIPESDNRE